LECRLQPNSLKAALQQFAEAQYLKLRVVLCGSSIDRFRYLNIAVWLLLVLVNGKEPPFDVLQDCCIIVHHPAIQTHLNRSVGNEQVFPLVAVEILDPSLLVAITTAEITLELWCNYASRCTSPFNPRLIILQAAT
jgi:hypothetical protein